MTAMLRLPLGPARIAFVGILAVSACFEDSQPGETGANTGDTGTDGGQGSTSTASVDESTTADTSLADSSTADTSMADTASTGETAVAWQQLLTVVDLPGGGAASDLVDVPVLVRLTTERFDYATAAPDGSDLRFVLGASDEAALPHEIEQWDPEGTSLVWVRLPTLDDGGEFLLLHGETGVEPWSDPREVWSEGYVAVWHFAEMTPAGGFSDSTAEANTMLPDGRDADVSLDMGPGGYGNAMLIDESGRMTVADDESLAVASALTMAAWVRPSVVSAANSQRAIVDKPNAYRLGAVREGSALPFANLLDAPGNQITAEGPQALGVSTWSHVVGTFDGAVVRLYTAGQPAAEAMAGGDARVSSAAMLIGTLYAGRIDELRVAAAGRSPEWIEVQYRSMLDELLAYSEETPLQSR